MVGPRQELGEGEAVPCGDRHERNRRSYQTAARGSTHNSKTPSELTIVWIDDDGVIRVRSKGIGVLASGSSGTVIDEDIVKRTARGWRIAERKVRRKASAP
ncbi:hypothetical protein [Sorangium sp. So ce385]|uniref:hypothetical protein n=1 Tax=Sorangium sp. So ce385 TaxID=3133308 RepID=UPI003F5C1B21